MRRYAAACALAAALAGCSQGQRVSEPRPLTPARTAADRAQWRERLRWPSECEESFAAGGRADAGITLYPLAGGRTLAEVACAMGAYQGSQMYFLIDGAKQTPLLLPTYEAGGPEGRTLTAKREAEVAGSAEFQSGELRVLNRYRGPGDCGSYAVYTFRDAGPVLKEFRAKVECDGEGAEHPEKWPVVNQPSK